jgi:hypothetical protein
MKLVRSRLCKKQTYQIRSRSEDLGKPGGKIALVTSRRTQEILVSQKQIRSESGSISAQAWVGSRMRSELSVAQLGESAFSFGLSVVKSAGQVP